ncbi:MAG: hypothetical protein HKP25_04425 [Marinicaulis sp.]|nr:hypothetical protein [Marinicaulis sp.]
MAKNAESPGINKSSSAPPSFAQKLILLTCGKENSAPLLGDLAEEYTRLSRFDRRKALQWYWGQAVSSAPHNIASRLSQNARSILAVIIAVALSYAVIAIWDIFVSRNAAQQFHQWTNPASYEPARRVYAIVQWIGFALAGALVAKLTFNYEKSLRENFLLRLAPAVLALSTPSLFALLGGVDGYSVTARIISIGLSLPAFGLGAAIIVWRNATKPF